MKSWNALSDAEWHEKVVEGTAWKARVERHRAAIAGLGGPLGKTKRISAESIEDTSNDISAYAAPHASSHEAAVILFGDHPHVTIFPANPWKCRFCPFLNLENPTEREEVHRYTADDPPIALSGCVGHEGLPSVDPHQMAC